MKNKRERMYVKLKCSRPRSSSTRRPPSQPLKSASQRGLETIQNPGFDKSLDHWLAPSNPNASKLSDHERANVEQICIAARHNGAAVQQLEELMEQLEGVG